MNELTTTRTPEVVAAEIRTFTASMLNNIIEIGRRMVEVKEMLPHGEFMGWVEENTGYSQSTANNFMRLFAEYGDRQGSLFGAEVNSQTFANLTYSKALALLALPEAEREAFVESHDVSDMTTKELKEAIRERDEAKAAADTMKEFVESLEKHNTELETRALEFSNENDDLKERIKELESRPVDVAVEIDEEAVKKAADEARAAAEAEWSAKERELMDKLAKAEAKAKRAAEKAKTAGEDAAKQSAAELDGARQAQANAEAEAERLRAELERAKREQAKASISGDADLAAFQLLFEAAQTDINKMRGLLLKVRGRENSELGEKLTAALLALAEKVKECAA